MEHPGAVSLFVNRFQLELGLVKLQKRTRVAVQMKPAEDGSILVHNYTSKDLMALVVRIFDRVRWSMQLIGDYSSKFLLLSTRN